MPPNPITESRAPVRPRVRYCMGRFLLGNMVNVRRAGKRPPGRDRGRGGGAMVEERVGEAFELGEQLTVVGRRLRAGEVAPEFALERFDGEAMSTVRLADSAGSVRLLNVVNSLDTPVCQVETRRWEQSRGDLPAG